MSTISRISTAALLLLSGVALAQTEPSLLYRNLEYRFGVIFPAQAQPMARDVTVVTRDGRSRAGRQFYLEQNGDRYSVTLVKLPEAPAVDKPNVDFQAEQILKKGTPKFNFSYCYDPGIPGRQLNLVEANGHQLRASVYMWDHQLYITEVSAPDGSQAALQFEQSITILDPMGNDLDNGQGSPACP